MNQTTTKQSKWLTFVISLIRSLLVGHIKSCIKQVLESVYGAVAHLAYQGR
jgi:hypothetical protein